MPRLLLLNGEDYEANNTLKREFEMTPMIQKVTEFLHLTPAGQVNLMAFPDDALGFASMMVGSGKQMGNLKDPYGYFVSQCKKYCREQGLSQNWATVYRYRSLLEIKDTDPMVDIAAADAEKNKAKQQAEKKTGFTCKNGCSQQPCDGWTWEHSQRGMCIKEGRTYNPNYLLEEAERDRQIRTDISQASAPAIDFKRPSNVLPNLFLSNQPISTPRQVQPVTNHHELKIVPATKQIPLAEINPFDGYTDNCYPEANEELEEVW